MTVQSCPSMTIVTPLRKSFEEIMSGRSLGPRLRSPRKSRQGYSAAASGSAAGERASCARFSEGDLVLSPLAQTRDVLAVFPDDQEGGSGCAPRNDEVVTQEPKREGTQNGRYHGAERSIAHREDDEQPHHHERYAGDPR